MDEFMLLTLNTSNPVHRQYFCILFCDDCEWELLRQEDYLPELVLHLLRQKLISMTKYQIRAF
jgi:hypothetical protein